MEPIGELGFVSVTIDEKLALLSSSQSERCIYRVHKKLRMVNEKAYEPEMVAIGPYHHELQEGGVKIEKLESGTLLDIKFKNGILHGVLQIPPFNIEDRTESFFRNLIAYEQYCPHDHVCYITDYLRLLNSLVDSPKDVALLSDCGVIQNWIGDDEVVSKMFNSISDETVQRDDRFLYADIFRRVNSRCQRRSSRWLANLKRNYLNSPWAWIAILVAFAVLTFTAIQTYFSAFPHK
ncbi:hypothetical protein Vadar_012274 [Vaccinium darrowii]|uniref:Uncharacterized protein n=1 Tax=Vaccinium darrowii TaxID=229202 RepID=A0ACB7X035_9ERIC|nr:hypothetical protein Vadar_012274 [Vaccinium darrowii]